VAGKRECLWQERGKVYNYVLAMFRKSRETRAHTHTQSTHFLFFLFFFKAKKKEKGFGTKISPLKSNQMGT